MDQNIIKGQSVLTNTGDVYAGVLSVGGTVYTDKGIYLCKPTFTNTTATPTLNLNGAGAKTIVSQGGGAVSAGNFVSGTWYMLIYDLSSDKFIIFNSATISSSLSIPVANTLFVSKSGNNSTALTGRFDLPFLTITAAQTAATSGQTIVVYPGTYTDFNLGKAGVNYHFTNGATIACTTHDMWIASDTSYTITGDGEFVTTTGDLFNISGTTILWVDCKRMSSTNSFSIETYTTATLYLNIKEDYVNTLNRHFSLNNDSSIYVSARLISLSAGGYAVATSTSSTTSLYINAERIVSAGTTMFDLTGNAEIRTGSMSYTGSGVAIYSTSGTTAINQNYYGDLNSASSSLAIDHTSTLTGTFNFYGRIISAGGISITASTASYTFYDDIITNTSTAPSILMSAATIRVKGRISNLDANAASYGITKTTGTLILDNATIVTNGGTKCVYSAAPQDIKVYGTLSTNKVLGVNITDVTGGVIQVDADIE